MCVNFATVRSLLLRLQAKQKRFDMSHKGRVLLIADRWARGEFETCLTPVAASVCAGVPTGGGGARAALLLQHTDQGHPPRCHRQN